MNRWNSRLFILALTGSLGISCSVKKYIPEGQQLYKGSTIEITDKKNASDTKLIKKELEDLLRPKPNKNFLGLKFRLWTHYRAHSKNSNFINRYLNKRFGEEPVYLSQVDPDRNKDIFINRLENKGFFNTQVSFQREGKRQEKASMLYTITLNRPYTLGNIVYEGEENTLGNRIKSLLPKGLLQTGERFDLGHIKAERERITAQLLEVGYYNFSPEIILLSIDSAAAGDKKIDLYVQLKPEAPLETLTPYRLSKMYIYPDYSLVTDSTMSKDTVVYSSYAVIQHDQNFLPKRFVEYILIRQGEIYNQTLSDRTRQRLFAIGAFGFVNIRYQVPPDATPDSTGHLPLEAHIYLSPLSKRSIRGELQALSKSNNFMGPLLSLNYKDRNALKGGEQLSLGGQIGYESQIAGGKRTGLSAFEAGINGELSIPRIISPFRWKSNVLYGIPRTKVNAAFNLLNRVNFYQLHSLSVGFGYLWNANRYAFHEIRPLALTYTRIAQTSENFEEILKSNIFLQRSFEQQFIPGMEYKFTFNELGNTHKKQHFWVQTNIDLSGNLLHLTQQLVGVDNANHLLGSEFARYARIDIDARHYRKAGIGQQLILRAYGGFGKPLGHSPSLPFIKQYFSGGPNSVRAFRIRSLGPGTYQPDQLGSASFFDQSGDIRIEVNVEYRFPIMRFLNGAIFTDAGNIWLARENPDIPGGQLTKNWIRELGVGVGAGLRLDIQFFVLRLDLSTPIRKPWLPEDDRWTTRFNYGSGVWRRDNLIWNFAIGYPF